MFDTLSIKVKNAKEIMDYFEKHEINLTQLNEDTISIALNEVTTLADLEELLKHFNKLSGKKPYTWEFNSRYEGLNRSLRREGAFM